VAELASSHPYLPKRVAMLAEWNAERTGAPLPSAPPARPFFAYVLALFVGRQAAGLLVAVYLIGIMAAIAIPNFMKYRERASGQAPASTAPYRVPSGSANPPDDAESPEPDEAADDAADEAAAPAPREEPAPPAGTRNRPH
jgi:hypothetical protein